MHSEMISLKEESSGIQSLKDEFTQRIADADRKAQLACKERDIAKKVCGFYLSFWLTMHHKLKVTHTLTDCLHFSFLCHTSRKSKALGKSYRPDLTPAKRWK